MNLNRKPLYLAVLMSLGSLSVQADEQTNDKPSDKQLREVVVKGAPH